MVPGKLFLTKGVGVHKDRLASFELALRNAGIEKWKELDIDCPFISLYEGEKYAANSYEPSNTVTLTSISG
jgi:arginine decarboxylase